jgi:hypothetical protein
MEEMREIVGNNLRGPPGMEEMREIVGNNLRGSSGMEEMREIVGNNPRRVPRNLWVCQRFPEYMDINWFH